ncbi:MAG: UDP-N-acetylmuramoyl-L-alanyl-D-glutamate--2,6-diaminopimelate ligase [Clostridia bacterium]|nr:UDP-N-acetylmuramoyl-L-alanyl-D-glutamate--2,6-diaminopimelate ligase [Clostridia bacterium]
MKLTDLMKVLGGRARLYGAGDPEISGLAYDSRKVQPGNIFVAIPGGQFDGHDFAPQAAERGAAVLIGERELSVGDTPYIVVPDSRRALAALSAAFYNYPDRRLRLIGVTGTNGKTTTTYMIKWLLESAGHKVGLVGTIHDLAGDKVLPATHTTPESLELFQLFALMEQEGCDYVVIEASSHALAQGRVSACNFAAAVFTNLTQDHLDYHGDIESYGQAKAILFRQLDPAAGSNRYGVINGEDSHAFIFAEACQAPVWTYGSREQGADLRLLQYNSSKSGMDFTLAYEDTLYKMHTPLIGKFNIYNSMAAIAVALAEGLPMEQIIAALDQAPQVAGRFEVVDEGQDFMVIVDYAHTPDGLKNLLNAAEKLDPRRLLTVFGCGGNRDTGKRPIMGRIAGAISDVAIITSDNPRLEDPMAIISDIETGIRGVCNNYLVEPDRAKAIELAINMAEPGDMVVLAGKGHEDYQIVGEHKSHFDDREIAREIIRRRQNK